MALIKALVDSDRVEVKLGEVAEADLACLQLLCSAHRTAVTLKKRFAVAGARPEKFKQALLGATSIIHADPRTGSPSAAHFLKVVGQLGIADEVKRKTTLRAGVVAHAVASGECAMAVQQLAELLLVEGVHVLGPFPDALQNVMPLAAAVHARSKAPQAAKVLIDLLASPRAKGVVEQCGLLAA